jgi:phage N-6-adenine-methyltransferase
MSTIKKNKTRKQQKQEKGLSYFKKYTGLFTCKTYDYITPKWLFKDLNDEFHFMIDAATTDDNPLQTFMYYTKENDGLKYPWNTSTFVNPPYGREINEWVKKAYFDSMKYGSVIVMLLAARTDTKWFHDYIYKKPKVEIRFIRGRLKFNVAGTDECNTAPFPSMIVIFRG